MGDPLDMPCPTCEQPPGMPCVIEPWGTRTPRQVGRESGPMHRERVKAAERHNARMTKRGYSREFTPRSERRIKIEIDRVPPTLADALKAKAKRDGISIRALTLQLWKQWVEGR